MDVHTLRREQRLPGSPQSVFAFFSDAGNLEAITPPMLGFRIATPGSIEMRTGTLIEYRLRVHGVPMRWTTAIREWEPPHRFVDEQLRGPYALWQHTHTFHDDGSGGTLMSDVVRYAIGFGPLGAVAQRLLVRRDLDAIFDYRAARVRELLGRNAAPTPAS
jgi:ligand-binding SRPBCC domain-containing protein